MNNDDYRVQLGMTEYQLHILPSRCTDTVRTSPNGNNYVRSAPWTHLHVFDVYII